MESGKVAKSGVILLTNKECPWRCLMCDLWKNTVTTSTPPGSIPSQIEFFSGIMAETTAQRQSRSSSTIVEANLRFRRHSA